jgi:carboxypeptidase PM20D1
MAGGKKKVGLIAGAGMGAAAAAALRRRWAVRRGGEESPAPTPGRAGAAYLSHLSEAVRIPTVGYEDRSLVDLAAFDEFHSFLERSYPLIHERLRREVVGGHSLLFTWEGSDPAAPPVLLMGHMDVVQVEPGTEGAWQHPPFGAVQDERYLWGRGSLDDKGSVVAIFEAVEGLLADGFCPDTTLHLTVGHDEETGGVQGAAAVARLFAERGVRLDFVLDEGGGVSSGLIPGVTVPVALIGVGEKGYLNVELLAEGTGGHSSVPPGHTAVGLVAAAVQRIEASPMPARFGVQAGFFDAVAPLLGGPRGRLLRRAGSLGFMLDKPLSAMPIANAVIRTTTAVTMIEGGVKPNVLPQQARAVVNFRILPGDTVAGVLAHVKRVVGKGIIVRQLAAGFSAEPSPLSDPRSASYGVLAATVEEVMPGTAAAPWIVLGATDSRHFVPVADNVYRFSPFLMTPDDLSRVHGTGERMRLAEADRVVAFYRRLVERACGTT